MAADGFSSALHKRRPTDLPDFQAVCLVGYGQNMFPFNEGPNVVNKALLPVGNEPIINHVLNWVQESGIQDVLLLCPPSAYNALSVHIHEVYPSSRLRVVLKKFTDGEKEEHQGEEQTEPNSFGMGMGMSMNIEEEGTCRLLRRFKSFIKSDFVLLPCDLSPPPSLTLASLLDKHRSTPKAVLTALFYEPSSAVKDGPDPILVALDRQSQELLQVQPMSSIEDDLELRMELMATHPTLSLTTRLQDAHVYVFRRSVLDLMSTRRPKDLDSLREQFIPWLIKGGWQRPLQERWRPILAQPGRDPLQVALSRSTSSYTPAIPESSELSANAGNATMPSSPVHSSDTESDTDDAAYGSSSSHTDRKRRPKKPFTWNCQVMVWKAPEPAAPAAPTGKQQQKGKPAMPEPTEALLRANTIGSYWELNRNFLRTMPSVSTQPHAQVSSRPATTTTTPGSSSVTATATVPLISPSAQISPDSLLGESTRVGERASIKKCVVGRHCVIGRGAKLVGCVLWDFVVVEENAKLENVILGSNSRIGDRAQLKDCELGTGYEAKPGAILKGERLAAGQEA